MNTHKALSKLGQDVINQVMDEFGYLSEFSEIRYFDNQADLIFIINGVQINVSIQDIDYMQYYNADDIVYYIMQLYNVIVSAHNNRLN